MDIKVNAYWEYVEVVLENPSLIWGNVFERQTNEISKDVVCTIVINKGRILEKELEEYYYKLCLKKNITDVKSFDFVMRGLVGSLVNRHASVNEVYFDLFNPSIIDFVIKNFFKNKYYILDILLISDNFNSVQNIIELFKGGFISEEDLKFVLNEYLSVKVESEKDDLFFLKIFKLCLSFNLINTVNLDNAILYFGDFLEYDENYYCADFFAVILFYLNYKGVDFFDNLVDFFEKNIIVLLENFDLETLSILTQIVQKLKVNENSNFYQELKKVIVEYLSHIITSMIIDDNVIGNIYLEEDFEEYLVVSYIEDHLSSFYFLNFNQSDIHEIYYNFDLSDAIQANMNSVYDPDFDDRTSVRYSDKYNNIDLIEDLFDRS